MEVDLFDLLICMILKSFDCIVFRCVIARGMQIWNIPHFPLIRLIRLFEANEDRENAALTEEAGFNFTLQLHWN